MSDSGPKTPGGRSLFDSNDPSALIIADRLASLGTLVAGVAHEINNPITYVLGNLGELARLSAAMREAILTYRFRIAATMGSATRLARAVTSAAALGSSVMTSQAAATPGE